MNIFDLDNNDFRMQFIKLSEEEQKNIILNQDFKKIDHDNILFAFNISNNNVKQLFFNDDELIYILLKTSLNKVSKINVFDEENQKLFINKPQVFLKFDNEEFIKLLQSMKVDIYKEFINNLNDYIYENDIKTDNKLINDIKNFYSNYKLFKEDKNNDVMINLKMKLFVDFRINDTGLINQMVAHLCEKKRNFFEFCRIQTYEQLYIYDRLNIVVPKELFENEMLDEFNISIELIKSLNSKHLIKIMDNLKEKGPINDKELFITAVKMYCLFGIDNSLKIINDKFTYSTDASIKRASNFQFTNERRKYRLNHPNEFFNYELIEKLKKSIQSNNIGILKKLMIGNEEKVIKTFGNMKYNYKLFKGEDKYISYINKTIKDIINDREEKLREDFYDTFTKNNYNKRQPLQPMELYNLFKYFNPIFTNFDENGNVIMDKDYEEFLLGNTKSNNDCLLRMVLNNQGLDYDIELINIINNYSEIQLKMDELNLNGKYSLLDTLDIYKTIQYNLNIDELDIPLSLISKTALSKKHLIVSRECAVDDFKKIYKEHKKKFASTIPRAKGVTKDNYRYKVLDKNDPELLTCGIDTGSCFKPGGPGGKFYEYCLTSLYGDVIGIKDPDNQLYIIPIIRNGNGIYGNGIDPDDIDPAKISYIIDALKRCYNEIIKRSNELDKIDFCTISSLHNYINGDSGYQKIKLTKPPMIGEYFYSDLTKDEIDNYVLVGDASNIEEFVPTIKYFIPRNKNYIYSPDQPENKLLIEQRINEIEFRSIDNKQISEEEKDELRKKFKKINVDNYTYIACNEDWYFAINDSYDIKSAVLPFDPRAHQEFLIELTKIKKNNENINKIR